MRAKNREIGMKNDEYWWSLGYEMKKLAGV